MHAEILRILLAQQAVPLLCCQYTGSLHDRPIDDPRDVPLLAHSEAYLRVDGSWRIVVHRRTNGGPVFVKYPHDRDPDTLNRTYFAWSVRTLPLPSDVMPFDDVRIPE